MLEEAQAVPSYPTSLPCTNATATKTPSNKDMRHYNICNPHSLKSYEISSANDCKGLLSLNQYALIAAFTFFTSPYGRRVARCIAPYLKGGAGRACYCADANIYTAETDDPESATDLTDRRQSFSTVVQAATMIIPTCPGHREDSLLA